MTKSTGIGKGRWKRKWIVAPVNTGTFPEENIHKCGDLVEINMDRQKSGESAIHVFRDENKFYMKVGLEFVPLACCPFCMEKLSEQK